MEINGIKVEVSCPWVGTFYATLEGYDGAPDACGPYSMVGHGNTPEEAFEELKIWVGDADL